MPNKYTPFFNLPVGASDRETAYAIIASERASYLNGLACLRHLLDLATAAELDALEVEINAKFDRRLALYDAGEKQWDTYVSRTMMLRS